MLNNIYLKNLLKVTVFKPFNLLNKILPKKDEFILLYIPTLGLRHNLLPLKQYLVENKYYEKYTIYCAVQDKCYFKQDDLHVKYITKMEAIKYFLVSRHVFYTAGQIPIKPSKHQLVIHMNHGSSDLKALGAMTNINNGDEFFFTYMLAPSKLYVPIVAKEYLCPEENVRICGEPMTDALFNKSCKYNLGDYKKIVLWMPTFRQSKLLNYSDSSEGLIPMYKDNEYDELNDVLKHNDIKLIVKIHTAQNMDKLNENKTFSNIEIMSNEKFVSLGYDIYELMPQVDALIGDYSSASLQFLLVNKPLAFVVPDMEEYKQRRGFCFAEPEKYMPGPIIKEKSQLYKFFEDLSGENDMYAGERDKVRNEIFDYPDGNNTKRVLELSDIHIN